MKYCKTILTITVATLLCYSSVAQNPETLSSQKNKLIAEWEIASDKPVNNPLFHYAYYETYHEKGILFTRTAGSDDHHVVTQGSSGRQSTSLDLLDDGKFVAAYTGYDPSDDTKIRSFIWTGKWELDKDILNLQVKNTQQEGAQIPGDFRLTSAAINRTFRFTWQQEGDQLKLFPLFDREDAYKMMLAELESCKKEPYWVFQLEFDLIPILSNSYSKLTAYTVNEVQKRIYQIQRDTSNIEADFNFIQNSINQWLVGKNGSPASYSPRTVTNISKTAIQRKWFLHENHQEYIIILLSSPNSNEQVFTFYPEAPPAKAISSGEPQFLSILEVNTDETFSNIYQISVSNQDQEKPIVATAKLKGTWSLNEDVLTLHSTDYEVSDHNDQQAKTSFNLDIPLHIKVQEDKLYVSRGTPTMTYDKMKSIIAEVKENGEYSRLSDFTSYMKEVPSSVTAYDLWQIDALLKEADLAQTEGRKVNIKRIGNFVENIVDKWHESTVEHE